PAPEAVEDAVEEEPVAPVEEIVEIEPVAAQEVEQPEDTIAPVEETTTAEVEDPVLDEAIRSETPVLPKGFATAVREPVAEAPVPQARRTWFQRLRDGLSRTSSQLTGQITSLFTKRKLDDD